MSRTLRLAVGIGTLFALVACSSGEATDACSDEQGGDCRRTRAAAPPAAAGLAVPEPLPLSPPLATTSDAGRDGAAEDDGPSIPSPAVACTDLLRCCSRVKGSIERAACVAVGYKASPSNCANAIIAYQVAGGCSHDPLDLPGIFNSDGSPNEANDCVYLEEACQADPSKCDAAYECNGVSVGAATSADPCEGLSVSPNAQGGNDYDCCVFDDAETCAGVQAWSGP